MDKAFTIGELGERTGCPVQTIRYYEREGLLPPAGRTRGNYRLYGPPHLERLSFIRNCRALDMTLQEIQLLLSVRDAPEKNCGEVNAVVDRHIEQVAQRIQELQQLQGRLKGLRKLCRAAEVAASCKILGSLSKRQPRVAAGKATANSTRK